MELQVIDALKIKKEIEQDSIPKDKEKSMIENHAEECAKEIMNFDLGKVKGKNELIKIIENFGLDSIEAAAKRNSTMQSTIINFSRSGEDGSGVYDELANLQREIKSLDPSHINFSSTGVLKKIVSPVRRYFEKFERADSVIQDIIVSLDRGKNTLKNDNITLDIEEESLRKITKELKNELALGTAIDEKLSYQVECAKASNYDEEKIKFVTEEILYPLRKRMMDIQQMVVINYQGIVAMEVIKRNNRELIRGVDRAKNVTLSALRTGVMVASALYNQKIVLKKINILNETTSDIISSTSRMLKKQGTEIHEQVTEATISPDILKKAFQDSLDALEEVTTFKQKALPKMKDVIETFKKMALDGEVEVSRIENGE